MSELTGRELDRAIAELVGLKPQWVDYPYNDWLYKAEDAGITVAGTIPRYHDDLNATAAVCRARGWALRLYPEEVGIRIPSHVDIAADDDGTYWKSVSTTWAEAAARSLYAALTAE